MKRYFVTGTDTNVGKTLVSSVLTLGLQGCYWKPIQSGASDLQQVKDWTDLPEAHFFPANYSFKAAIAPDQAAQRENIIIDLAQCILPETTRPLIVEGAGGLFVPLTDDHCMLDFMQRLNLPIIIVARGTLGTINHTLLTIEVLRQRNLSIHGIIFSGDLMEGNQNAIEEWGDVKTLFHIPRFEEINAKILQDWTAANSDNMLEYFK